MVRRMQARRHWGQMAGPGTQVDWRGTVREASGDSGGLAVVTGDSPAPSGPFGA